MFFGRVDFQKGLAAVGLKFGKIIAYNASLIYYMYFYVYCFFNISQLTCMYSCVVHIFVGDSIADSVMLQCKMDNGGYVSYTHT
jgi:hypothetical protein